MAEENIQIKQLLDGDELFYPQTDVNALVADGEFAFESNPSIGSTKLINSDALASFYGSYVENPEWIRVVTDAEGKVLCGLKADGSFSAPGGIEGLDEKLQAAIQEL